MAKDNITTEKHFDVYRKEVLRLLGVFGLKHRHIEFEHTEFEQDDSGTSLAACEYDRDGQWVSFMLSKNCGRHKITTEVLRWCAYHEVLHYLLSDFRLFAERHELPLADMRQEEHRIINRILNATFGKI